MNRRFLALALAGTLSLSLLAGCGSSKEPACLLYTSDAADE